MKQISILIPTHNYDCSLLIQMLRAEILHSGIDGEIILGDDCSDEYYAKIYETLQSEGLITLIRSGKNLGAGRMRNYLARRASGEQLLLIDSDTIPASDTFIQDYLQVASLDRVIVGGFVYPRESPPKNKRLRYKYGQKVETRSLTERQQSPWQGFVSMCFLVPRRLFLIEGFPVDMGMGYEDAYFGYRLGERGIPIIHIDNPVIHALKETSDQYLDTTERYVENLYQHRELLVPCPIRLLQLYRRLQRVGLVPLCRSIAPAFKPALRWQLTSSHPWLPLFSLYKLLHLCSLRG